MQGLMQDFPLTLQHVLWRMERLFPKKEIVSLRDDGVHRYTYPELVRRICRVANALTRLGVKPGDRVATVAWNNHRHMELYYAVPCMGAVLHTVNLRLFPDQLAHVINDAADRFVFADATLMPVLERVAGRIPCVERVIRMADRAEAPPASPLGELLDLETLLADEPASFRWPALDERQAAAMCYTSGTTGMPKGVVYSHRSNFLHTLATQLAGTTGIRETDTVLAIVPMFHANAWGLPYATGMAGAKILLPGRLMGDPASITKLARDEGATALAGVPTIWLNLVRYLEETGERIPGIRTVLCGGAALPESLMDRMDRVGLPVLHAWGMTETSPIGTCASPRSWHTGEEERHAVRLTQGTPAPAVELRIADLTTGEEQPWDGEAFGEIHVRGPWVSSAYHGGVDPGRFTEDGWFRTGDVATMSADGFMKIVDRTKDVIKSGGEWISSVELENALMAHPDVQEAAVIGLAHPRWSERPVAYVVPRAAAKGTLQVQTLLDFLRERVAAWWLPDEIRFIDEVPKTSVGKFDKKVLRANAAPIRSEEGDPAEA